MDMVSNWLKQSAIDYYSNKLNPFHHHNENENNQMTMMDRLSSFFKEPATDEKNKDKDEKWSSSLTSLVGEQKDKFMDQLSDSVAVLTNMFSSLTGPAVDFEKKDNEYLWKLNVSDFTKDELQVSLADNRLVIKGNEEKFYSKFPEILEKWNPLHFLDDDPDDSVVSSVDDEIAEKSKASETKSFYRSITLPSRADTKGVKANLKDGMLLISIPRSQMSVEKEKERREKIKEEKEKYIKDKEYKQKIIKEYQDEQDKIKKTKGEHYTNKENNEKEENLEKNIIEIA